MSWDGLLATAAAQHGYFTTAQAADHGISRRALTWRTAHGSAERVSHGLYRLSHWPLDPGDDLYALQALAPFGTFSHQTALTLLGLTDIIPWTIHFTIPETSRLRPRRGVTLHRSRHGAMTDRALRDGLWVSTARRALLDAAREGADPDQLISAARDARGRAMLTPGDLDELRRGPPCAEPPRRNAPLLLSEHEDVKYSKDAGIAYKGARMLAVAKITAKGQTTIPQDVRAALHVVPGDLIAWEVGADGTATVRRVQPMDIEYLRAIEGTLGEWAGAADEAAYRDL